MDQSQSSWRLFCALENLAMVRSLMGDYIKKFREEAPEAQASWSKPDNTHLTLKFFGNVPRDRISKISAAAERVVKQHKSFPIEISGTGVFPPRGTPKVLWIGINDLSGNLVRLHQAFDEECAFEGFPKEDRAFHPHLTVARIRKPQGAKTLAQKHLAMQFPAVDTLISELVLFRSELGSKGSTYSVISRHGLCLKSHF